MKENSAINLPRSWKIEKLQDACVVFSDGDWIETKNQSSKGIRLVQTGNIGFGFFKNKEDKSRFISEETFNKLNCSEVLPGDLLVSRLPDPVGKSCIIPDLNIKMITGVDCTIIRTKDYLLSEYLAFYQMSNQYLQDVQTRVTGTTRSRISRKNLGLIEIPIPPLSEQQQIVALLGQAFAAIDQAQANIEKNSENAKALFENWTFQTIKNANWNTIHWGEICDFTRGPFGGSLKKSMFVESGYAVYEQKQAIHNDYDALRYFIDEKKFQEMKRFEVKPADLLMSCSGVTLGRISEVPEDAPKGIINQALLKLTVNPDKMLNDFLVIWIRSKIFQDLIFKVAGGAAQPNVPGVKILKNIKLPCPNTSEQQDFIQLHDSMKEFSENSIKANIRKNELLEELKKSILQKAFTGQLTSGQ